MNVTNNSIGSLLYCFINYIKNVNNAVIRSQNLKHTKSDILLFNEINKFIEPLEKVEKYQVLHINSDGSPVARYVYCRSIRILFDVRVQFRRRNAGMPYSSRVQNKVHSILYYILISTIYIYYII